MSTKKKKRRLRLGRLLIVILGFLMVFVVIAGAGVFAYYKYVTSQAKDMNILLIGTDGRESTDNSSRADTLMMIHVDKDTNTITTVSLPRDSYVYIPCEDAYDKVNHAFSYGDANWANKGGGRACTMKTVQNVFELPELDNYVEVDFSKMMKIVDLVGGIDLTPTHTFCEMDENELADQYCFTEGKTIHMNGAMALAYSRHRKSDSDIYRAGRQEEVVKALFSKAKGQGLWDLYKLSKEVLKIVDTNLTFQDLIGYADMLEGELKIDQQVVSGSDDWEYVPAYGQEIYYYKLDQDWLSNIIKTFQ